jgi:hypothetical protein
VAFNVLPCGLEWPKLRERGDGRKGCLSQVAQGQQGSEERRPGLRTEIGRDGQEALQRVHPTH